MFTNLREENVMLPLWNAVKFGVGSWQKWLNTLWNFRLNPCLSGRAWNSNSSQNELIRNEESKARIHSEWTSGKRSYPVWSRKSCSRSASGICLQCVLRLRSRRAFRNAIKIKFAASWCNTLRALHAAPQDAKGTHEKKKTLLGLLWGTRSTKLGLLGTVSERLGHAIRGAETPTLPPRNGRGSYTTSCRLPRTASARLRRCLKTTRQNCQSVCLEF